MDDPKIMRLLQGTCDLNRPIQDHLPSNPALKLELLVQIDSIDEFHGVERQGQMVPNPDQSDDIRMLES